VIHHQTDPASQHGYEQTGRYELRNPDGDLCARGTVAFCYGRLMELVPGTPPRDAFNAGWTCLPAEVENWTD
jgi:hypothetical protein